MKETNSSHYSSPSHYAGDGKITAKDAARSMMHGVNLPAYIAGWWFNAFKYIWRWVHKNGVDDLYKARECIDELIRAAESDNKLL